MQGVDLPVEIQAVLAILTAYSIQRLIFFIYSLDLFTSKERKRMEALQNEILAWKAQLLRISAMASLIIIYDRYNFHLYEKELVSFFLI